jgi:acyl-CoA synthetase (AMP-forming)/AMP-acid ligase II
MTDLVEASTIGEMASKAAEAFGSKDAVVGNGTRLSYRDLDRRSREVARRLLGRSVAKGSRVGISFGNGPEFIVALIGASRIGVIAVPISTFARGRELQRLIRYGDLTGILTTGGVVGVDQRDRLTDAIPGLAHAPGPLLTLPSLPQLRWIEMPDLDERPTWAIAPEDPSPAGPITDAMLDAAEAEVTPWDVALMIHTSGTTSDPKGVPHLHDTVTFRARDLCYWMQYKSETRTYTSQPLFWIGGLTMSFVTSLVAGGTSVWSERFEPGEVLRLIEQERVTRLMIYPHQAEQLLAHPDFATTDRSSLETADYRLLAEGATPTPILSPEGHRMALGMSETFGPYTWGSGGSNVIAPITAVQAGLEVRCVDETGKPVIDGETGEIVLRGRCVTPGYHRQPKTVGFDADGWFHTGDRGQVDGDAIHFLGRMTEMIKTAGANVAPAEVVDALLALDGVKEAYVFPLPDAIRGELVSAAVVVDDGSTLDPETIKSKLKKDLSPYKVPSVIALFTTEEIPWTPTFKVRRGQLAEMIQQRAAR